MGCGKNCLQPLTIIWYSSVSDPVPLMRTRLCRMTLAALVLHLLALVPVSAKDGPEDLYFDGYQAWKKAEALLKVGKRDEALPKLKEAQEKITQVQNQFPDWQPEVVNYRLQTIRGKLAELVPPPLTPRPLDPPPPKAGPPPPPVHTVPEEKTPYIPTVKPPPDYLLNRPKVPFIFNGELYYKMLLSLEKRQPAPAPPKAAPQGLQRLRL
jgi:hypothetical protein